MESAVADGQRALDWVRDYSPVLRAFGDRYADEAPFDGYTIAVSSPLTPHTGMLIETLWRAGAEVVFCGEPGTNHGGVIEELDRRDGIEAFVEAGMGADEYEAAHEALLQRRPDFVLDDGCYLIAEVHAKYPDVAADILGGAEQTTAGIRRLESMEDNDVLEFPVYGVNDTPMKHFFDNVHGTSESTLTGMLMTTNTMIAGKTVVVAGYGYVGRGVARKAEGFDADTIVTDVDPRKALEAIMDGHRVMPMVDAAEEGDYFITATGGVDVLRREHFEAMSDGAIIATAGTAAEISVDDLEAVADRTSEPRDGVTRYHLPDGRRLNLLADGYVVNLAAPNTNGNPTEVMDLTFSMMFMAAHELLTDGRDLPPGLYAIPDRLDRAVAETKLDTMGVEIDSLSERQREYLEDWKHDD